MAEPSALNANTIRLRERKKRAGIKPSNNDYVKIRHPGYSGSNTLLTFAAVDQGASSYGVHFGTVHVACAIIANNRHDGWLSRSRSYAVESDRIAQNDDSVLPAGEYFYHVPLLGDISRTPLAPYPVVPNFRAWKFPHGHFPPFWDSVIDRTTIDDSALSADTSTRDGTCRLTDFSTACDYAHLIPSSEKDWFAENELQQYFPPSRRGPDTVDLSVNTILLRTDVHRLYDGMKWSIVPKSGILVAHITQHSAELEHEYHNIPMQPLRGIVPEYLYARFAWDITPNLLGFLHGGQERYLAIRQPDGSVKEAKFSASECRKMAQGQGRGRSASPNKLTKRVHAEVQEHGSGGSNVDGSSCNAEVDSGVGSFGSYSSVCDGGTDSDGDESDVSTRPWNARETRRMSSCSEDDAHRERGRKRRRVVSGADYDYVKAVAHSAVQYHPSTRNRLPAAASKI
jgi:hypothetical protein